MPEVGSIAPPSAGSVAGFQGEHDLALAVGLDLGDGIDDRLGRRFRILAHVMPERRHHVFGVQRLAVVELDAGTQVEGPHPRVVGHIPGFGEFGLELSVVADFGQLVEDPAAEDLHVEVFKGGRVEGVGGRSMTEPDPEGAAFFRRCRLDGTRPKRRGRACRDAQGCSPRHEVTTRHAAGSQQLLQFAFCHVSSLVDRRLAPITVFMQERPFSRSFLRFCSIQFPLHEAAFAPCRLMLFPARSSLSQNRG